MGCVSLGATDQPVISGIATVEENMDESLTALAGESQVDDIDEKVTEQVEEEEEEEEEIVQKRFVLQVLPFVTAVQRQHGLRHEDHERYRRFCSRRLRRIRRALKFLCGKKRFTKKTITREIVVNEQYLHILLFEAERAWSYFCQLKEESADDDHKKFHMVGRLRKAAQYATELHELIGNDGELCDERTELEIAAYATWMNALLHRERQSWKTAFEMFGQAKIIYDQLGGVCGDVLAPIYAKKVEDIEAQIRYCSFMLGGDAGDLNELLKMQESGIGSMAMLKEKFARVLENSEAESENLSSITWRGRVKPVASSRLQINLLSMRNKEKSLGQVTEFSELMDTFDELFGSYGDTISTIHDEIQAENKAPTPNEANLASLKFANDYVSHLRYEQTIKRSQKMIENALANIEDKTGESKIDDVVQLYTMVLQTLGAMESIESLQEDVEFGKLLSARILMYKAMRCVYIAQGRVEADPPQLKEAYALLDRGTTHSRLAQSELAECGDALDASELMLSKDFETRTRRLRCLIQAYAFMNTLETNDKESDETAADSQSLKEKLASFKSGSQIAAREATLVSFPPDFEPTACKPLFFDLASNYIDFPDVSERAKPPQTGAVDALKGVLSSGWSKLGLWG